MTTRIYYLPVTTNLQYQAFIDRLILQGYSQMPKARVIIVDIDDTEYELETCTSFSISMKREDPIYTFSCAIALANIWNPRTSLYPLLLEPDIRKRIKIYSGQVIDGVEEYVQILTGVFIQAPETYKFGSTNLISISGKSLSYLLSRIPGTYSTTQYTGNSKTLIQYWCTQAGISYNLTYTDSINITDKTIAYKTALAGLNDIKQVLGPDVEMYFTATGMLIMRDVPWWTEGTNEYDLTDSNLVDLSRHSDLAKIWTVANVAGNDPSYAATWNADENLQDAYGEKIKSVSSGLIVSYEQSLALAKGLIKDGRRHINMGKIKIALNPNLNIGSLFTIQDSFSITDRVNFRVEALDHSFKAMSNHDTSMSGYLNESSSSSCNSSSSSSSSESSSSSKSSSSRSSSSSSSSSL